MTRDEEMIHNSLDWHARIDRVLLNTTEKKKVSPPRPDCGVDGIMFAGTRRRSVTVGAPKASTCSWSMFYAAVTINQKKPILGQLATQWALHTHWVRHG